MKKNVGGLDRKIRLFTGSVLVLASVAGYTGFLPVASRIAPQALTSVILVLLGVVLLVTGLTQRCLINSIAGRDTSSTS